MVCWKPFDYRYSGWDETNVYIADITSFGWVNAAAWAGIDINEFPNLKAWVEKLKGREGVRAGLNVPERKEGSGTVTDPKELERIAKENAWLRKQIEADAK